MVQNASVFSRSLLKCQDQFMVQAGKDIQQLTHFASFRSRVNEMINAPGRQVANILEAEQLVWRQLAEELMRLNLEDRKNERNA